MLEQVEPKIRANCIRTVKLWTKEES